MRQFSLYMLPFEETTKGARILTYICIKLTFNVNSIRSDPRSEWIWSDTLVFPSVRRTCSHDCEPMDISLRLRQIVMRWRNQGIILVPFNVRYRVAYDFCLQDNVPTISDFHGEIMNDISEFRFKLRRSSIEEHCFLWWFGFLCWRVYCKEQCQSLFSYLLEVHCGSPKKYMLNLYFGNRYKNYCRNSPNLFSVCHSVVFNPLRMHQGLSPGPVVVTLPNCTHLVHFLTVPRFSVWRHLFEHVVFEERS